MKGEKDLVGILGCRGVVAVVSTILFLAQYCVALEVGQGIEGYLRNENSYPFYLSLEVLPQGIYYISTKKGTLKSSGVTKLTYSSVDPPQQRIDMFGTQSEGLNLLNDSFYNCARRSLSGFDENVVCAHVGKTQWNKTNTKQNSKSFAVSTLNGKIRYGYSSIKDMNSLGDKNAFMSYVQDPVELTQFIPTSLNRPMFYPFSDNWIFIATDDTSLTLFNRDLKIYFSTVGKAVALITNPVMNTTGKFDFRTQLLCLDDKKQISEHLVQGGMVAPIGKPIDLGSEVGYLDITKVKFCKALNGAVMSANKEGGLVQILYRVPTREIKILCPSMKKTAIHNVYCVDYTKAVVVHADSSQDNPFPTLYASVINIGVTSRVAELIPILAMEVPYYHPDNSYFIDRDYLYIGNSSESIIKIALNPANLEYAFSQEDDPLLTTSLDLTLIPLNDDSPTKTSARNISIPVKIIEAPKQTVSFTNSSSTDDSGKVDVVYEPVKRVKGHFWTVEPRNGHYNRSKVTITGRFSKTKEDVVLNMGSKDTWTILDVYNHTNFIRSYVNETVTLHARLEYPSYLMIILEDSTSVRATRYYEIDQFDFFDMAIQYNIATSSKDHYIIAGWKEKNKLCIWKDDLNGFFPAVYRSVMVDISLVNHISCTMKDLEMNCILASNTEIKQIRINVKNIEAPEIVDGSSKVVGKVPQGFLIEQLVLHPSGEFYAVKLLPRFESSSIHTIGGILYYTMSSQFARGGITNKDYTHLAISHRARIGWDENYLVIGDVNSRLYTFEITEPIVKLTNLSAEDPKNSFLLTIYGDADPITFNLFQPDTSHTHDHDHDHGHTHPTPLSPKTMLTWLTITGIVMAVLIIALFIIIRIERRKRDIGNSEYFAEESAAVHDTSIGAH